MSKAVIPFPERRAMRSILRQNWIQHGPDMDATIAATQAAIESRRNMSPEMVILLIRLAWIILQWWRANKIAAPADIIRGEPCRLEDYN